MSNSRKVEYADWTEMVFEGREKTFGAYLLRQKYRNHVLIGLGLTSALALLFSFSFSFVGTADSPDSAPNEVMHTLIMPPPPPLPDDPPPPPPPPPPMPPQRQIAQISFPVPEPAPADQVDSTETIHDIDSLKLIKNFGATDIEGDIVDDLPIAFDGDGDIPEVIQPQMPADDVFVMVDEEPEPINMAAFQRSFVYPQLCRDAGIEGMVVLRILVDSRGNYKDHRLLNSPHPMLSKEVESRIRELKFTPAVQGGRPIPFWVNVPFNFKILK